MNPVAFLSPDWQERLHAELQAAPERPGASGLIAIKVLRDEGDVEFELRLQDGRVIEIGHSAVRDDADLDLSMSVATAISIFRDGVRFDVAYSRGEIDFVGDWPLAIEFVDVLRHPVFDDGFARLALRTVWPR